MRHQLQHAPGDCPPQFDRPHPLRVEKDTLRLADGFKKVSLQGNNHRGGLLGMAGVLTVSAKTPGSVTLGLTGGRTIKWGSADESPRKAEVLAALMTQPGKVYDVSSPELPTIR